MDSVAVSHEQPASIWAAGGICVQRGPSFLRLIMPVAFPVSKRGEYEFEERCQKIAASGRWHLLKAETHSFLPHVRIHFNSVRRHEKDQRKNGPLRLDAALAFGYIFEDSGIGGMPLPGTSFSFHVPGTKRRVEVDVTGAQLGIFRMGVGFVAVEIVPRSDSLSDWLDTLHFLRFYRGRAEPLKMAGRSAKAHGDRTLKIENFLGPLLADAELDGEKPPFSAWADGTDERQAGHVKELYTPGELLTYASLFVDAVPEGEQRRLLYHVLHRFRSATQSEPWEEDENDEQWLLPYQKDQQFVNSIQGSAFVAFDAERTSFNSQTLPSHLRSTYFVLFLLALLQRFALDQLSEAIAESTGRVLGNWAQGQARGELKRITGLNGQLLDFTGRCYFVQVSQMAHHHSYYSRLREVNEIEDRYREVTEEVHALRAHAGSRVSVEEERSSRRVAAALMVITCVLLPLQVIVALFSTKLPDLPGIRNLSPTWSAVAAGLVMIIAIAIALMILSGGRRRRRR